MKASFVLTSLIDLIFILLIFFLVTVTLEKNYIKSISLTRMPAAQDTLSSVLEKRQHLFITVDSSKVVLGAQIVDIDNLAEILIEKRLRSSEGELDVALRVKPGVSWQNVNAIMDEVRKARMEVYIVR